MSIFKEFAVTWKGIEYVVAPNRVMGLVEVVEDVITMEELNSPGVKRAKISRAFKNILGYAGHGVTQEEIYNTFFTKGSGIEITTIVNAILLLMIPPEHLQSKAPQPKTPKPRAKKKSVKG
jgi:hypothetical protein